MFATEKATKENIKFTTQLKFFIKKNSHRNKIKIGIPPGKLQKQPTRERIEHRTTQEKKAEIEEEQEEIRNSNMREKERKGGPVLEGYERGQGQHQPG